MSDINELKADSGGPANYDVFYALRPSSVKLALERVEALPWEAMWAGDEESDLPYMGRGPSYGIDYPQPEGIIDSHVGWLREAAAADRGVLVFWSI